jgi:hypothetical protein
MKTKIVIMLSVAIAAITPVTAQETLRTYGHEKFGNTLNLGFGAGYGNYNSRGGSFVSPGINLNYEFDVMRNLTLAPSVSASTYRSYRYWGDGNNPTQRYSYRQLNVPIGVKASYYFDEWLRATDRWDFYVGTTVGFVYRSAVWESGYDGDRDYYYASTSPLFVNMHIGSELHLTQRTGIFLDLSTGMSTFGFGFHL